MATNLLTAQNGVPPPARSVRSVLRTALRTLLLFVAAAIGLRLFLAYEASSRIAAWLDGVVGVPQPFVPVLSLVLVAVLLPLAWPALKLLLLGRSSVPVIACTVMVLAGYAGLSYFGMQVQPERVAVSGPGLRLFNKDGTPSVWYAEVDGHLELFNRKGVHPQTGVPLLPMTPEIAKRLWRDYRSAVDQENARLAALAQARVAAERQAAAEAERIAAAQQASAEAEQAAAEARRQAAELEAAAAAANAEAARARNEEIQRRAEESARQRSKADQASAAAQERAQTYTAPAQTASGAPLLGRCRQVLPDGYARIWEGVSEEQCARLLNDGRMPAYRCVRRRPDGGAEVRYDLPPYQCSGGHAGTA